MSNDDDTRVGGNKGRFRRVAKADIKNAGFKLIRKMPGVNLQV